jgi:hypothetical protein
MRSRSLFVRATILWAAFALLHALGLRAYTSILSGTAPTGDPADLRAVALGCAYVVFYFAAVVVAPILTLAAGLLALFRPTR